MALFWYSSGIFTVLAALALLFPWLRTQSFWGRFLGSPRQATVVALLPLAAIALLYLVLVRNDAGNQLAHTGMPMTSADGASAPGSFAAAARAFASANGDASPPRPGSTGANTIDAATRANAGSMDMAVVNLEARLAKGGGSDGDWELLAKSFDFLGRPEDAAKARAHQLPALTDGPPGGVGNPTNRPAAGAEVSGEVTLAGSLSGKASAGETLFIVAKSVDSPGIPVAVFRASVGNWPLKFTLNDSQSMMPGRSLSTVGRVTIEARISHSGQPLPASGDLQGTSGVINPADHQALKIVIDHTIP